MRLRRLIPILCFLPMLLFLPGAGAQSGGTAQQAPNSRTMDSGSESFPEQLWISGNAVKENGQPAAGAYIELDCRASVTREATVDANGKFSFRIGEGVRSNQQDQDLNQGLTDPFGRSSTMSPFDVGTISTRSGLASKKPGSLTRVTGCTLQASLSGYKSSTIELGTTHLSMLSDVGIIALFPIEKVRGTKVSATSLLAPKAAKKALQEANKALRKERTADAEKFLKSATALYPKYGEAWYQLGRLYQSQRRIDEARQAYRRAVESDKLFATPYVWLGMISAAEQKWQETADLTDRALDLEPTAFPEAYYLNALAHFDLGNLDQAERSAHRAVLLDSTHRFPKMHLILASSCANRNDLVGLIEELRNYIKNGPRGMNAIQGGGDAPCLGSSWESASESQKQEMASSAGPEIRLLLAEALLSTGMITRAKVELAAYLNGGDRRMVPPQLSDLSEPVRNPKPEISVIRAPNDKAEEPKEAPIDYLNYSLRDQPDFESAMDQAPLAGILSAVGNNVSRLFANLFSLSATESVQLERSDRKGNADRRKDFKYLYLCLGTVDKKDPFFDEYRSDERGSEVLQAGLDEGYMLTVGFMSSPLIFHPIHQSGSEFRLLGYQKLRGRNTFVVAYAQIPGQSRLKVQFQAGKKAEEMYKQGIAWIDAENYQIIRVVSELLTPLPQIRLNRLRTEIDFDRVRFNHTKEEFWMPLQVIVTVDWNNRLLRNSHAYSDFRLFDVRASVKIEQPKGDGKAMDGSPDPAK
jgi:tetratricopeptide (TPR) repeat protein